MEYKAILGRAAIEDSKAREDIQKIMDGDIAVGNSLKLNNIDLDNYAQINGNYPNMTVGKAESLSKNIQVTWGNVSNFWAKIASITMKDNINYDYYSGIILVNTVYGTQQQAALNDSNKSGIIEIDARTEVDGSLKTEYCGISIISGNLKDTNFAIVPDEANRRIDFYTFIGDIYKNISYTVIDEKSRSSSNPVRIELYKTPETVENLENAIYAVNRNTAGELIPEMQEAYAPRYNAIRNGNFKINQRGQTVYGNEALNRYYTVDGWELVGSTAHWKVSSLEVADDGIIITNGYTSAIDINNPIERGTVNAGEIWTLTAKVSDVVNGEIQNTQIKSLTFLASNTGNQIFFDNAKVSFGKHYNTNTDYRVICTINAGKSVKFHWVDLTPTEFALPHKDPDPVTELARCQANFIRIKSNRGDGGFFGVGTSQGRKDCEIFIPLPTTLRTNKSSEVTVTYYGDFIIRQNATSIPVTGMIIRDILPNQIVLQCATADGATTYTEVGMLSSTTNGAYIDFDAQL